MSTYEAEISKFEDKLYLVHVKVPEEVYEHYRELGVKRIIVTIGDTTPVHNAFLPSGDGSYYIKIAKTTMKEGGYTIGQKVDVKIEEDASKYGMPMPREMEELLQQDPEGEAHFHKLTPGKIRSLLFKINGYKSSDARIAKAIIIVEHLKANNGKLDWKMLQEAWKGT